MVLVEAVVCGERDIRGRLDPSGPNLDSSDIQQGFVKLDAVVMVRYDNGRAVTEGRLLWSNEDASRVLSAQAEASFPDLYHHRPPGSHDANGDTGRKSQLSQAYGEQARAADLENFRFLAPGQTGQRAGALARGDGRSRSQSG